MNNGLVMPYNTKKFLTSVAFKERTIHNLLEDEN